MHSRAILIAGLSALSVTLAAAGPTLATDPDRCTPHESTKRQGQVNKACDAALSCHGVPAENRSLLTQRLQHNRACLSARKALAYCERDGQGASQIQRAEKAVEVCEAMLAAPR
ncbi:MAG: hypothetical protein E7812_17825 [Phenylobacterium sp.]|nr:MAG: hypothetical protein E7812_17825 [Phenylobacterium sp.]